jgi:hypothetical protein
LVRRVSQDLRLKQLWSFSSLLAAAALCAAVAESPSTASAQTVLAADGALASPVKAPYAASGGSLGLRLGRRLSVPGGWETPELGVNYAFFASSASNVDPGGFQALRGVLGARLTFTGILRPGIFAHIGLGRVTGNIASRNANGMLELESISHTSITWDGGVTLDLALASSFELGAHAGYSQIFGGSSRTFRWFELGGHMAIVL